MYCGLSNYIAVSCTVEVLALPKAVVVVKSNNRNAGTLSAFVTNRGRDDLTSDYKSATSHLKSMYLTLKKYVPHNLKEDVAKHHTN